MECVWLVQNFKTPKYWANKHYHGIIPELITAAENVMLCMLPDEIEVWNAVRSMGPLKAPGLDGFTAIFYQKYWSVVKDDAVQMVRSFSENGFLLRQMNHSHLVLIHKGESPNVVGQFRPISLYNVAYKIISKILASRLRKVLPKLILGNQNAFVPNRNIQENIILVHKLMCTLKRKQRRGA